MAENKERPNWLLGRIRSRQAGGTVNDEEWDQLRSKVREYLALPDYPMECRFIQEPDSDLLATMALEDWESSEKVFDLVLHKWSRRYVFHYPEPGISFTYCDWKVGRNTGRAIMPKYDNFSPFLKTQTISTTLSHCKRDFVPKVSRLSCK